MVGGCAELRRPSRRRAWAPPHGCPGARDSRSARLTERSPPAVAWGARRPSSHGPAQTPRCHVPVRLPPGAGAQSEPSPARAGGAAVVARWPQGPGEWSLPRSTTMPCVACRFCSWQAHQARGPQASVVEPCPRQPQASARSIPSREPRWSCVRPRPLFFPGWWLRCCEPGRRLMSSPLTPPARCGSVL